MDWQKSERVKGSLTLRKGAEEEDEQEEEGSDRVAVVHGHGGGGLGRASIRHGFY